MKEMVGGCCVCSDERGWDENPLVYCDGHGCNVAVHQACYGIVTVPVGSWYCRKCESQERAARVRCELCPQKEGALKRTDSGNWCHVVCALFIPEAWFGDTTTMEPIILSRIPAERFNKSCYICEEQGRQGKSTTGACMQCNRAGCKQHFHVTCAQGQGLLGELPRSGSKDDVKYVGFCTYHYKKMKKDTNMKVYSAYKPLSLDSALCSEMLPSVAEKPGAKTDRARSTSLSASGSVTLSQPVAALKTEVKERSHSKSTSSDISSSGDAPTPLMYKTPPTSATSISSSIPTSKSSVGKFTTANFIETTIVPSPANFGTVPGTTSTTCVTSTTTTSCSLMSAADLSTRSSTLGHTIKTNSSSPRSVCTLMTTSPSVHVTSPASSVTTSSPSSLTHMYRNFVGQNFSKPSETNTTSSDVLNLSSPELARGKKRQPRGAGKKARTDKNGVTTGKAKTVKSLLEGPSAASPPTLSPVYASNLIPPAPRKSETKRAISNIISSLSPKSEDDCAPEHTGSSASHRVSAISHDHHPPVDSNPSRLIGPAPPSSLPVSSTVTGPTSSNSVGQVPMTMEQLLERQWEQGSEFLMQQGQHFDIASLLSCLYQLKAENRTLEERITVMTARRDHLLAVNARLSLPLASSTGSAAVHPSAPSVSASVDADSAHHPHDNGLPEDSAAGHHTGKSPRMNASLAGSYTAIRDVGVSLGYPSAATTGQSPSSSSALLRSHLDSSVPLVQPALSTGLIPGSILAPASGSGSRGTSHPSPAKKARVSAASTVSLSSAAPLMSFSLPMIQGSIRPPPGIDSLGFFSRPADTMELHRQQQLLQQQMLLAAAGTPLSQEHNFFLQQIAQQRLVSIATPPGSVTSSSAGAIASAPQHQRTPPSLASHHTEKNSGNRKDKSL